MRPRSSRGRRSDGATNCVVTIIPSENRGRTRIYKVRTDGFLCQHPVISVIVIASLIKWGVSDHQPIRSKGGGINPNSIQWTSLLSEDVLAPDTDILEGEGKFLVVVVRPFF